MSGARTDGRERFLRAIAERIAPERIEEIHIFPPIQQGGRESGVAVIAVRLEEDVTGAEVAATDGSVDPATDAPVDLSASPAEGAAHTSEELEAPSDADAPTPADTRQERARLTVLRAHYRLTLRGAERGKWEVAIVEEADAPASTVEEVVRGVHERAGVADDGPERLTGEAFRALLAGAGDPWIARP
jgi:hypothetical protein